MNTAVAQRQTLGVRLNNPGNLELGTQWFGLAPSKHRRFCTFKTPELGIRALAKVLLTYQRKHKLRTIDDIINRYAPPFENDTESYIKSVVRSTGFRRDEILELTDVVFLVPLVTAIIKHENAGYRYPPIVVETGCNAAL